MLHKTGNGNYVVMTMRYHVWQAVHTLITLYFGETSYRSSKIEYAYHTHILFFKEYVGYVVF